jgi:hypothetical protein
MSNDEARPPFPPFTRETAIQKVRLAEDGWNTRDLATVALAYTVDSRCSSAAGWCVRAATSDSPCNTALLDCPWRFATGDNACLATALLRASVP